MKPVKFDYTYPRQLDLHPDSEMHKKLLSFLLGKVQCSADVVQAKHGMMREIDKTLTCYYDLSEAEKIAKSKNKNRPVSVVVPECYAELHTNLAYLTSVFLNNPICRYIGVGPEDVYGAKCVERIIDLQNQKKKLALNGVLLFKHALSYGRGFGVPAWSVEKKLKIVRKHKQVLDALNPIIPSVVKQFFDGKSIDRKVVWEGNELFITNPYASYPDPNVPAGRIQKGSFFAYGERYNYLYLLDMEKHNKNYFNVKYLGEGQIQQKSKYIPESVSQNNTATSQVNRADDPSIDVITIEIKFVPNSVGFGNSIDVETWEFMIAGDRYIIYAERTDNIHGMLKVIEACPDFDAQTVMPTSMIETIMPLQTVLNFWHNSRVMNIQMTGNNSYIIDPSAVYMGDFDDPSPGMLIRATEALWGKSVRDIIMPLPYQDVTQGFSNDSASTRDLMKTATGTFDFVQGRQRIGGERITATEIEGTGANAVARLFYRGYIMAMQAIDDLAYIELCNTQQYMSENTYINMIGDYDDLLKEEFGLGDRVEVTPYDVIANVDIIPTNAVNPNAANSPGFERIFQTILSNQILSAQFDPIRLVKGLARQYNVPYIGQYLAKNTNLVVQPNQQVLNNASAGNISPIPEV